MSKPLVAGILSGDVIAGKYRVDRLLGVGGMGAVVAAHHLQLDDQVAIKFLLPRPGDKAEAIERFVREARAAVKIKSPHVARVTDVGTLDSGMPYMVMEYLDGCDLSQWIEQHGRVPIDQACELALQACVAIAEAHALGIVHRDLKPANLFVTRRGDGTLHLKVLDFGISKLVQSDAAPSLTRTSAVMGSPLYMSPEQLQSSRDVDQRTDIWALGVILYELVTGGSMPFPPGALTEVVLRIVSKPPTPLRDKCAHAPLALEEVIFKCLEKDPAKRYRDVAELAWALGAFTPRAHHLVDTVVGIVRGSTGHKGEWPDPAALGGDVHGALPHSERATTGYIARRRPLASLVVIGLAAATSSIVYTFWSQQVSGAATSPSAPALVSPSATASAPALAAPRVQPPSAQVVEPAAPFETQTPTPTQTSLAGASLPPSAAAPTAENAPAHAGEPPARPAPATEQTAEAPREVVPDELPRGVAPPPPPPPPTADVQPEPKAPESVLAPVEAPISPTPKAALRTKPIDKLPSLPAKPVVPANESKPPFMKDGASPWGGRL